MTEKGGEGDSEGVRPKAAETLSLTLAHGVLFRGLALAVGGSLGLLASALLVRSLGVAAYGTLALALTIVSVAGSFADLGVGVAVTRMTSIATSEEKQAWAHVGLRIALIMGTFGTLACWCLAFLVGPPLRMPIAILAPLVLAATLRATMTGVLRAHRRVVSVEGTLIGQHIMGHGSSTLLALSQVASVVLVAWSQLAARWLALLPLIRPWRALTRAPHLEANRDGERETDRQASVPKLLAFAFPVALATLTSQALQRSDVIMLGGIRTPAEVGAYVPVLRLVEMAGMLLTALGSYYLVVSSHFVATNDRRRLQMVLSALARWATVLAGPLLAVLIVAPSPAISFLFGPGLQGSDAVARILAVGYAFHVVTGHNGQTLTALGQTRAIAIRSVIAFLANIGLNVLLIPPLGAAGAALATTIVIIGLNVANSIVVWRVGNVHVLSGPFVAVLSAFLLSTAAAGVVVAAFNLTTSPAAAVGTGLLVSLSGLIAAWATLTNQERSLLRSVLASVRAMRQRKR